MEIFEFLTAQGLQARFTKVEKIENIKRNGAARTDEFRERFERHRSHSNIPRTVDARRRPQKRPGPDLTEMRPSCMRLSTQKGSLWRGGSRRQSEGGPAERPGKACTKRSKTK